MATNDVFADGGEMGELMRSVRWPTRRSFPSSAQLLRWYRLSYLSNETTVRAWPRAPPPGAKAMGLIILLVVLVLLFGGGGFYYGPPYHYYGGGLGLVLLIVVLVLLFRGRA